jgi:hypothetical protein
MAPTLLVELGKLLVTFLEIHPLLFFCPTFFCSSLANRKM